MAYGDIGAFMPGESAYRTPGAYTESMRMEATKRATYLSQMDQFYANLEESARQFDLGHELEQLKFGLEEQRFGLEGQYFGLAEESLDWQKEYGTGMLALEGRKVDVTEELGMEGLDIERDKLSVMKQTSAMDYRLAREELDLARDKLEAGTDIAEKAVSTAGQVFTGSGGSYGAIPDSGPGDALYIGGEQYR